ncbi:MAG: HNH endonuclease [Micrococcales bacterium]|nr:HNH endonuclease [Micrococcales bacterium]MCL2667964.1 HNH endonuclease [Micrococcales bacterium]
MEPGPALVAVLAQINLASVDDAELVVVLAAYDRMASWAYEGTAQATGEISRRVAQASCRHGRRDYGQGRSSAAAQEVALALGTSRSTAARLVRQDPDEPARPAQWRLPPPGTVRVNVTISAESLLGITDEPAHIPGVGTIDAVTARALAHQGIWRRIVTDPLSGAIIDVGRTKYRPPAALAAHVAARDPHCVCGTCTQPAQLCDLDHTTEWRDGGTTSTSNLAPLCRASHTLKTDGYMTLTVAGPGQYQWTTPLGNTYQVNTNGRLPRRRPAPRHDDIPPPF